MEILTLKFSNLNSILRGALTYLCKLAVALGEVLEHCGLHEIGVHSFTLQHSVTSLVIVAGED
jgi:hypothetical protein